MFILNPVKVSILHSISWFFCSGQDREQEGQEQDGQGGEVDRTGVRQPRQTGSPSDKLEFNRLNFGTV